MHTLGHSWLIAAHHVELGVVEAVGLALLTALWWSILESQLVIAMALVLDAHLEDLERHSLLDVETVLVAAKVAVVDVWIGALEELELTISGSRGDLHRFNLDHDWDVLLELVVHFFNLLLVIALTLLLAGSNWWHHIFL